MYVISICITYPDFIKKKSKIPLSIPGVNNFMSLVYIDDSFLQGNNYQDYFSNVLNTIEILRSLGFTFHADKSKCVPTYVLPT